MPVWNARWNDVDWQLALTLARAGDLDATGAIALHVEWLAHTRCGSFNRARMTAWFVDFVRDIFWGRPRKDGSGVTRGLREVLLASTGPVTDGGVALALRQGLSKVAKRESRILLHDDHVPELEAEGETAQPHLTVHAAAALLRRAEIHGGVLLALHGDASDYKERRTLALVVGRCARACVILERHAALREARPRWGKLVQPVAERRCCAWVARTYFEEGQHEWLGPDEIPPSRQSPGRADFDQDVARMRQLFEHAWKIIHTGPVVPERDNA